MENNLLKGSVKVCSTVISFCTVVVEGTRENLQVEIYISQLLDDLPPYSPYQKLLSKYIVMKSFRRASALLYSQLLSNCPCN